MRTVGIKVLKNKLSEYVRIAAGGETVLICDRDRVVAELVPPRETRSPELADAALAELVRTGVMTPALHPPGPLPQRSPVMPWAQLASDLETDRAER